MKIIGKTLQAAEDYAQTAGFTVRPVLIDGEHQAFSMNHEENRINVALEKGTVVGVEHIG